MSIRVSAALGIVVVCVLCVVFALQIHVSRVYRVRASYAQMPADDKQLDTWIKSQPGVVADTVRTVRTGDELQVRLIMSQTLFGDPPIPDFSGACDVLEYAPLSHWSDIEPALSD